MKKLAISLSFLLLQACDAAPDKQDTDEAVTANEEQGSQDQQKAKKLFQNTSNDFKYIFFTAPNRLVTGVGWSDISLNSLYKPSGWDWFGHEWERIESAFGSDNISQASYLPYFQVLQSSELGKIKASEHMSHMLINSPDRQEVVKYDHPDLYRRLADYHSATVFQKNNLKQALASDIVGAIDDRQARHETESYYLPSLGKLTLKYDFAAQRFFVKKHRFFINSGPFPAQNQSIFEFINNNTLTSFWHQIDQFIIDIPAQEAQTFIDNYGTATRNDDEFEFRFFASFKEHDFSEGRTTYLSPTKRTIPAAKWEFQQNDVWALSCITLLLNREALSKPLRQGQRTYASGPVAETKSCDFAARIFDAAAAK